MNAAYSWSSFFYELFRDGEWFLCENESIVAEELGRVVFVMKNGNKVFYKQLLPKDVEVKEVKGLNVYTGKVVSYAYRCIREQVFNF